MTMLTQEFLPAVTRMSREAYEALPPEEKDVVDNFYRQHEARGGTVRPYRTEAPPAPAEDPYSDEARIRAAQERDPVARYHRVVAALSPERRAKLWDEKEAAAYTQEGLRISGAEFEARRAEVFHANTEGRIRPDGRALAPCEIAQPQKPVLRESAIIAMSFTERQARASELAEAAAEGRIMTIERERQLGLI